jgi:hypothetical protein
MPAHRPGADPGPPGDLLDRDRQSLGGERLERDLQDPGTVTPRVGAQRMPFVAHQHLRSLTNGMAIPDIKRDDHPSDGWPRPGRRPSRSPRTPATRVPIVRAATDPDAHGGEYYGPDGWNEWTGHPVRVDSIPGSHDADAQRRLWDVSEQLTGVRFRDTLDAIRR